MCDCDWKQDAVDQLAKAMLRKYANHRVSCGCFICRTFTDEERASLADWLDIVRKP